MGRAYRKSTLFGAAFVASALMHAALPHTVVAQNGDVCPLVPLSTCDSATGPNCGPTNVRTILSNIVPGNLFAPSSWIQMAPDKDFILVMRAPCTACSMTVPSVSMFLTNNNGDGWASLSFQFVGIDSFDAVNPTEIESISPLSALVQRDAFLTQSTTLQTFALNLDVPLASHEYIGLQVSANVSVQWGSAEECAQPTACGTCAHSVQGLDGDWTVIATSIGDGEANTCWPSIQMTAFFPCEPSATPSSSASPSQTPSQTRTPSGTPSNTQSPTFTATPSVSPSASATASNSRTPTATSSGTPSATASPSASPIPCNTDSQMVFFSNLDTRFPTLDGDALIRGAAGVPVALTFTAPCHNCTLELDQLAVLLQSENDTTVSFAYKICQYYSPYFVTCPSQEYLHTPPVRVYQATALYRLPLNITYRIPHGLTGDLKLFLMPNANVLWRMSELAPAIPRPGLSEATGFLVRPPCTDLVQTATTVSCVHGPDWSHLRVFPSVHLTGRIPCSQIGPNVDRRFALDPELHPSDQTSFVNVCSVEDGVVRLIDTTAEGNFVDAAALNTLSLFSYIMLFDRPCESCTVNVTALSLPLARLGVTNVQVRVSSVKGNSLDALTFTPFGNPVALSLTLGAAFYEVLPATPAGGIHFEPGVNITGVAVSFSAPLLWQYGYPLNSVSINDKPVLVLMPVALTTTPNPVSIEEAVEPASYYMPGVYMRAVSDECVVPLCELEILQEVGETRRRRLMGQVDVATIPQSPSSTPSQSPSPLPADGPIPCFGTGSITVVDNTLTGRFLQAGGQLLTPFKKYLIAFDLPCTKCNVHLTHLSMPLQRIIGSTLSLNISMALLERVGPNIPSGQTPLKVLDPALVSTAATLNLPAPLALYTFLLPESFTAVDRQNETLRYGLIVSVSTTVLWRGGLGSPVSTNEFVIGKRFGWYEPPPPVPGAYQWLPTAERPGVWLRSWAEPFWSCISPSPVHHPSCIPRPARRMLEVLGIADSSLHHDRITPADAESLSLDRKLNNVPYCSSSPAPHASTLHNPSATPSRRPTTVQGSVRAHITFDLLFDASIVVPGDFSLGGLLTDLLRASIADALRTLISFIDLLVIETRRLEAAGANRQLGIVHIASESVVRVRVTVTTNVEGDSVAAKTATDEMQARLADLTVADLLAAFAESDAARERNLGSNSAILDRGSVSYDVGGDSAASSNSLTTAQKGGIAGGVSGGVVLIAIVVAVALVVAKRRRQDEDGAPAAPAVPASAAAPAAPAAPAPARVTATAAPRTVQVVAPPPTTAGSASAERAAAPAQAGHAATVTAV